MKITMRIWIGLLVVVLTGTCWADDGKWAFLVKLHGDKKARHVGDLLTVQIVEESAAKKDANQKTDKTMGLSGSASFGHPRVDSKSTAWTNATLPSYSLDTSSKYEGKGSMESKDTLSGAITVRVTDVLPNGNLMIEGRRSVVVQRESLVFVLTGTVRVEDIDQNNTVKSTSIADATIRYESTGSIASTQKKGVLASLLDWLNIF